MSKKGPGHQKRKIGKTAVRSQKRGSPSDMSPDRSLVTALPVKGWLKSASKLLILLSALVLIAGLSVYSRVKNYKNREEASEEKYLPRAKGALTFTKDVAPIVFRNCAGCHRPNQSAPFSLLTYQEIRKHARQKHCENLTTPPIRHIDLARGFVHVDRGDSGVKELKPRGLSDSEIQQLLERSIDPLLWIRLKDCSEVTVLTVQEQLGLFAFELQEEERRVIRPEPFILCPKIDPSNLERTLTSQGPLIDLHDE